MYIARLNFASANDRVEEPGDLILRLLSAFRNGGQVLGREFPIASVQEGYSAIVLLPASDALDQVHNSIWVQRAEEALVQVGIGPPDISVLGEDPTSLAVCSCPTPSSYILYTDYLSLESPLRCGDEFLPVPLYRIPPRAEGEHQDIAFWASEYEACDRLWMNSDVLELAAYRQLHDRESRLTQLGLDLRDSIASVTHCPVYYYLLEHRARSRAVQVARRCPKCGGEWFLDQAWHGLFDFTCDRCHLLSNMG